MRTRNALGQFVKEDRTEAVEVEARLVERRVPQAANQQIRYVSPGQPMVPDWDAANAIRWGYMANTFVYRCVDVIASAVAGLPIRCTPLAAERDPATHDPRNPLARLLSKPPGGPNPNTSARQLVRWSMAQYLVAGRMAWELDRPQGAVGDDWQPVGLYPLAAPLVNPEPTSGGVALWSGFRAGRPDKPVHLRPAQVFYHWKPSANDYRQAESVLQAARLDVSVAVMQDRYDHAFLRNDARPAAVVVHEAFAEDDRRDAWRREFLSDHAGPDQAGKVAFVETSSDGAPVAGALHIETLGISQKDAQFVQRYEAKVRAICVAFGVPLTMLGDASGRTFANASEEHAVFWEARLSDIADLEDALNLQLAPRFGGTHEVWFDTSGIAALKAQTDPVTAQVGAPALVQAQIITVNEARADYALPPVPDGDRMMTAEEIAALRGPATEPRVPEVTDGSMGARALDPGTSTSTSSTLAGVTYTVGPTFDTTAGTTDREPAPRDRAPRPDPGAETEARAYQRELRATAAILRLDKATAIEARTWEKAMRRLFSRQRAAAMSRLEGKRGNRIRKAAETRAPADENADAVFDRTFWVSETADVVDGLIEHTLLLGADSLGIDFDLPADLVDELIQARANQLAGEVTETTYQAIKDAMVKGVAEGEGIPDLAKRIQHVFDVADETRATRIARTEVVSAYNAGKRGAGEAAPADVVGGFEWIATRDSRTRDSHAGVDGQVIAAGGRFSVGGSSMAYPGDPAGPTEETINCRCTMVTLTPEQYAEATGTRAVRIEAVRAALLLAPIETEVLEFRRALVEAA